MEPGLFVHVEAVEARKEEIAGDQSVEARVVGVFESLAHAKRLLQQ